jgi:hypothetical protein
MMRGRERERWRGEKMRLDDGGGGYYGEKKGGYYEGDPTRSRSRRLFLLLHFTSLVGLELELEHGRGRGGRSHALVAYAYASRETTRSMILSVCYTMFVFG